tara:strand:+ start:381 stop:719 length:339 start_codon:yes stop_codon:yes gene_type:complete
LKHLILTILILLLYSSAIGNKQKERTLYQLGEYPDWEWVEFGDKNNQPTYQGQVKDGKPNGLGVLISTNGWKYFGSWINGEILSGIEYDNYGNIIYRWIEGKRKYHYLYRSY